MSMRPENIKWSNHSEEVNVLNKALYWKTSIKHQILLVSVWPQPFAINLNIVVGSLAKIFFFHSKWIGGVQGRLSWRKCFPFCPTKTLNLPNYSEERRGKKKKNMKENFIPLISAIFSLQTVFEYYIIEPPCLMTLLMHCYQVVPSVFGQMCSLVCLLSINYLYLKFNGSYIYLDICT